MARFNKASLNRSLSKLRSSANELKRQGEKLKAAGRDLDRANRSTQARLRQLPSSQPRITLHEQDFLDGVRQGVIADTVDRPHDVFLSHATADLVTARELHAALESYDVDVWMDDFSIKLGTNIVRAIDRGISLATVGVVLVTPAVIAGRYWVEREFSALLNSKETVIPVLDSVTWEQLQQYSPMLHLNKGLSTHDHTIEEIAELIVNVLD